MKLEFLLSTMVQGKSNSHYLIWSYVLSGLEVCGIVQNIYWVSKGVYTPSWRASLKRAVREENTCWAAQSQWKYIPQHRVYHPRKKTISVVFDRVALYQQTSLNEQLLPGPDLTNTLNGVLSRFREHPVALIADVEAMFHQGKFLEDADLWFLWWP